MLFKPEDLDRLPLEKAETIPAQWYTDPEIYNFEHKNLFGKSWQYVCSLDHFSKPGDLKIAEVNGREIVLVIDEQNKINAFYNICRHRAGPLAWEDGNVKTIRCRYHGWRYDLGGNLCGITSEAKVNFPDYHLFSIKTEVWERMIFISLASDPASVSEDFYGIKEKIFPLEISKAKFHKRVEYLLECNWKVYADNFLEGYHLPYVHPSLNKLLDYQNYQTELFQNYSLQFSPLKPEENFYGKGEGKAFYFFVYPNFMLNILPGRLQTNVVVPLSPNKTKVIFDYYYENSESAEVLALIKEDLVYSDQIQQEDIRICEKVQKGLASGVYQKGRFCPKQEKGVHHFQNLLRQTFAAASEV